MSSLLTPRRSALTRRALVLALVLLALGVMLAVPIRSWLAQRAQIAGLEADVAAAQERVTALQVEKERWEDPAFVAAEARRRLHFVMPGEIGYVALGADGEPVGTTPTDAENTGTWAQRLLESLRAADAPPPLQVP